MKIAFAFLLIALIGASFAQTTKTTEIPVTTEKTTPDVVSTTEGQTTAAHETTTETVTTIKPTPVPTTTEVPTVVPTHETTTQEVPTTTKEVPTTTKEVPTTTPEVPTTTGAPITTTPEPATLTSFFVNGTHGVCLKLDLEFNITIKDEINNKTYEVDPKNVEVDDKLSSCNTTEGHQVLFLTFGKQSSLAFTFEKREKEIVVKYIEVVVKESKAEDFEGLLNGTFFSVGDGLTYRCNAKLDEVIQGNLNSTISIHMKNFKYLAFKSGPKNDYTTEFVCDQDTKIGEIVPIAVGCALAALILIILVAYVIGRRRNRQKGYQSV